MDPIITIINALNSMGGVIEKMGERIRRLETQVFTPLNFGWEGIEDVYTRPILADYTWLNQGLGTASEVGRTLYMSAPASASVNVRGLYMSAPATPYTFTVRIEPTTFVGDAHSAGIFFRESSSGKLAVFKMLYNSSGLNSFASSKYTDQATFSANYTAVAFGAPSRLKWLRIADNGYSRICSFSSDGKLWFDFHSVGRTDFLTADQIGLCIMSDNASYSCGNYFLSCKVG